MTILAQGWLSEVAIPGMPWQAGEDKAAVWDFLRSLPFQSGSFLQTPAWGEYQQALGHEVRSLAWWSGQAMGGLAMAVRERLPAGFSYWRVSKGPLFTSGVPVAEQTAALRQLKLLLAGPGVLFVRLEPTLPPLGAVRTLDDEPRATVAVDLRRPWPEVIAAMQPKTRYNLSLAQRHGLNFRWAELNEYPRFWKLLQATAGRDGFRTHAAVHYRVMLERFINQPLNSELATRLAMVERQGEFLAASLVVVSLGIATYLHGASSRQQRELMAPYLLHGRAMELLRADGIARYDFWGVQPSDGSWPDWAGFTRFKLGFGGQRYEAPGTFDLPYQRSTYALYTLLRRLRRLM